MHLYFMWLLIIFYFFRSNYISSNQSFPNRGSLGIFEDSIIFPSKSLYFLWYCRMRQRAICLTQITPTVGDLISKAQIFSGKMITFTFCFNFGKRVNLSLGNVCLLLTPRKSLNLTTSWKNEIRLFFIFPRTTEYQYDNLNSS